MTVKPILFNAEMVRAILEGRKSCTRRLPNKNIEDRYFRYKEWADSVSKPGFEQLSERAFYAQYPPYHPGDILYVRETWGYPIALNSDKLYVYRADEIVEDGFKNDSHIWHPSIHMPKEAARIWLKVIDVRVERLQECGKGWCLDIEKEGVVTPQDPILYTSDEKFHEALRYEFEKLWNSTIKKTDLDRYGWDANPYVFAIKFVKIDKPEEIQNA